MSDPGGAKRGRHVGDSVNNTLTNHLTVATCMGCGARSRRGVGRLTDLVGLADAAERMLPNLPRSVCVRRPGAVADASEYRRFAERPAQLAADDRALTGLARLLAAVTPRVGRGE